MSERIVHVYRVTDVAEFVVDDDGIYEDDVEMLRDVVEAAKQGVLEFGPPDAEFVVMTWGEDSTMTVRAVVPEGAPKPSQRSRPTEFCPRCLEPQIVTRSGATCSRGHEGLPGISRRERDGKVEARREVAGSVEAPPPPVRRERSTTRRKPRRRNSR